MRRALIILMAASLLLAAAPAPAVASSPVTVTFQSASLVAKGVAVSVTFDYVCEPVDGTPDADIDYANVKVAQTVRGGQVAYGQANWYGRATCDGVTVNSRTDLIRPDALAFKHGVALVEVYISYGGVTRELFEVHLK